MPQGGAGQPSDTAGTGTTPASGAASALPVAPPPARPAPGALALSADAARQLEACVHCGFCLPACPTYRELGEEADSPRGRIDIIAAAHRGEVALADPDVALHLDRCLDCRACESACPSGVRYHLLYEDAVAALAGLRAPRPATVARSDRPPGGVQRRGRGAAGAGGASGAAGAASAAAAAGTADAVGPVAPDAGSGRGAGDHRPPGASPAVPAAAALTARSALMRLGLRQLVRRPWLLAWAAWLPRRLPPLARRLPTALVDLASVLPPRPPVPARRRLPSVLPAHGMPRGAVDLFLGCVQDACFGDDNVAMAHVLRACGYEVHVAAGQTCCGALHAHTGDRREMVRLARCNVAALAASGRPLVVGAAGCGAVLKEYGRTLADTEAASAARALAARVRDLSEAVAAVPAAERPVARPPRGGPVRVTYHDPCHLCHAQGVREQPRALLAALPGLELIELPEADACCGSAGVYNLTQPELSASLLARKVEAIRETGARWVVTANPGCVLQLRLGLRRAGLDVRVRTLAEVLAEAYLPCGDPGAVGVERRDRAAEDGRARPAAV